MLAGSFDLRAIVEAQRGLWFVVPQFLGFVTFAIAGIAETRRLPFDLPEAESELVAGFHTEYSGMKFGLFFVGEYVGIILVSALMVDAVLRRLAGAGAAAARLVRAQDRRDRHRFFVLLRAALPRPRYDQLMAYGWKAMLPLSLLNLPPPARACSPGAERRERPRC